MPSSSCRQPRFSPLSLLFSSPALPTPSMLPIIGLKRFSPLFKLPPVKLPSMKRSPTVLLMKRSPTVLLMKRSPMKPPQQQTPHPPPSSPTVSLWHCCLAAFSSTSPSAHRQPSPPILSPLWRRSRPSPRFPPFSSSPSFSPFTLPPSPSLLSPTTPRWLFFARSLFSLSTLLLSLLPFFASAASPVSSFSSSSVAPTTPFLPSPSPVSWPPCPATAPTPPRPRKQL